MRKLLIAVCALLMLTGCADTSRVDNLIASEKSDSSEIADTADDIAASYWADRETTPVPQTSLIDEAELANGDIDIDLTILNPNMLYAQVFQMTGDPESYLGKTVRAKGTFLSYTDSETGEDIFAVYMTDAAACCAQGLEFHRAGEFSYPEDYPAVDDPITVTGTFSTYKIGVFTYCELVDAVLETE